MLEIGHLGQQWHVDEGNCRAFNQMNPDQHAHLFFFFGGEFNYLKGSLVHVEVRLHLANRRPQLATGSEILSTTC